MKDRDFLMWLHERLTYVHRESECVDYMHKLRAIIRSTPPDQETPIMNTINSLEGLCDDMKLHESYLGRVPHKG